MLKLEEQMCKKKKKKHIGQYVLFSYMCKKKVIYPQIEYAIYKLI